MSIIRESRFESNGITIIVHSIDARYVFYEKRRSAHTGKDWPQDNEGYPLCKTPISDFVKAIKNEAVS